MSNIKHKPFIRSVKEKFTTQQENSPVGLNPPGTALSCFPTQPSLCSRHSAAAAACCYSTTSQQHQGREATLYQAAVVRSDLLMRGYVLNCKHVTPSKFEELFIIVKANRKAGSFSSDGSNRMTRDKNSKVQHQRAKPKNLLTANATAFASSSDLHLNK